MATPDRQITLPLPTPEATDQLAIVLAKVARPGDIILLEGPIGAGKSHFARAYIRARLGRDEDVPSPTFTLVQEYDGHPPIWHADLYRLSHPDDLLELGLEEAFGRDICLVEWPERFGTARPGDALTLVLRAEGEGRIATLTGGASWQDRLDKLGALLRD